MFQLSLNCWGERRGECQFKLWGFCHAGKAILRPAKLFKGFGKLTGGSSTPSTARRGAIGCWGRPKSLGQHCSPAASATHVRQVRATAASILAPTKPRAAVFRELYCVFS
jgi:hypothetical protein